MKISFHPERAVARFGFTIVSFVLASWFSCNPLIAAERPNIIFLLTDDQTARAAGCYGNTEIQTPNIDGLARDGVRFTNYYNATSICMASRCCLMTGLYEYRHGCNFGHGDLERRFMDQSYPVLLRKAGYFTGFAGKIGFQIQGEPFEAFASLFDQWAGGPGQTFYETKKNAGIAKYADQYPHCSRAYGAWAVDFLKAAKQSGKPFCLSISFKAPHMPFTPDPLDTPLYKGKSFTKPPNYGVANAAYLSPQSRTSRAFTSYRFWITDYDKTLAAYYALIAGVDVALGTIREELERQGFADNTVIIFTSDNGYNCGAHGFGDKVLPYEEASKSPLLIYDPRLPEEYAGKVSAAVTGNVDMAPTILAMAGVPAPDNLDGASLLPLLTNPSGRVRDVLPLFNFWGIESAQSMAVVTPEWKYIYWYYGGKDMTPVEELFHVGQDRFELELVTARYEAQLETMRRYYDAQLDHVARRVFQDHGYKPYPTLFDRSVIWSRKAPLLKPEKEVPVTERGMRGKRKANVHAGTPNIVFVLFDDMGWGQPQSYLPDSALRTPNLDRLAKQGMRFTDAHSGAAVCTPTRYGLLTGRCPSRIGQFGVLTTYSKPIIPAGRMTVASLLKQHGYATACIGKWHLGLNWVDGKPGTEKNVPVGARITDGPNALGFDYFCGYTHARNISTIIEQDRVVANVPAVENQPLMIKKAIEWIDQRAKAGGPFFLYLPMCPPHEPIVPSPQFEGKSGAQDLVRKDPKYGDWLYQGDAMLGQILEALDRNKLSDNTLVIAASDNGAEHRAYEPLRESKRSIYEGGHRVPFIARWPGKVKPGLLNDHTICLNDLMATAAEIVGAKLPDNAGEDSVSLIPELLGTAKTAVHEATIHQSSSGDLAIRQGPWKLVFLKSGKRELYNLQADLSETKDVLSANTDMAAKLTALMQSYIDRGRSTPGSAQKNDFDLSITGGDGKAKRKSKGIKSQIERDREMMVAADPSFD